MEFAITSDQRLIQESARTFLADAASLERLRASLDSDAGWDRDLWSGLGSLGFTGLMTPEAYGGSGLGAVEMALVLEETGRTLAAAPFFETAVLATQAIMTAGTEEQRARLLPALASGDMKATWMGGVDRPVLSGGRLRGRARFVPFGHIAELLIVATSGDSLIALPATTSGVRATRVPNLDRTRPMAEVHFDDVEVPDDAILGRPSGAGDAIARTLAVGAGLLAAEQTGGAQFCLDSTVEYAKQRVQFRRPIGSFQAVKHDLANMMVMIEASRSAAYYAAAAIDEGGEELAEACSIASSWASDCYNHCSGEAIQLHGGIGFTWEHHAHLYFKRARASSSWFGGPEAQRDALARIILESA